MMEEKVANSKRCNFSWSWCLLMLIIGVLIFAAGLVSLLKKLHRSSSDHLHAGPTNVNQRYATALELALQFFDIQKSGKLENNRVSWRGDSGLRDGSEANLDLSKGLYDAGDLMKFGFPMAFTATVLSWAILEYGDHLKAVKQLEYAHGTLKWITDYLINAHPFADVLYIQVGNPDVDHNCWERPETTTEERPLTQVNTSFPGSDIVAETSAALAAASVVYKQINHTYSSILLSHAKQLFTFADTYRGSYSVSIPKMQNYYNSSGYGDELLWAGSWLYHATKESSYFKYVTEQNENVFGNLGSPSWFSWDDKHAATQVLLSRITFFGTRDIPNAENLDLQMYRETAEIFMCGLLPDSPTATTSRTKSGLIWIQQWNPLQHSVASAFLAVLYSDYMVTSNIETLFCSGTMYKPADLRNFAISQADYVLGNNPLKMSYLVGFGTHYPQYVHHRGSSIPTNATTGCKDGFTVWCDSPYPNPNVAVGALVGGPFFNETYNDYRKNSIQGEPTTYNAALMVALLSGLVATSTLATSF